MKTPTLFANTVLYGFYELDAEGIVIHSRVKQDAEWLNITPAVTGRNFFEEVFPGENAEEFRRRFNRFLSNRNSIESFTFNCRLYEIVLPVKVMLVRVSERENSERANLVIVDIREVK